MDQILHFFIMYIEIILSNYHFILELVISKNISKLDYSLGMGFFDFAKFLSSA